MVVFARNYTSGAWTQLTTATVGTSEVTLTGKLSSGIAGYVSTAGQMMVRVQTSKGATHTVSADMVKVVITP